MAIDTENERRVIVYVLPLANSSVGTTDRRHVIWIYPTLIFIGGEVGVPLSTAPPDEFYYLEGALSLQSGAMFTCWEDLVRPWNFIKRLAEYLQINFQVPKNHNFIAQGYETPDLTSPHVWAKFDTNRNPLGWFGFIKNMWQRFYTDAVSDGEMRWVVGDSDNPPAGWQPLVYGLNDFTDEQLDKLVEQYVEISSGRYSYYAARYIGY